MTILMATNRVNDAIIVQEAVQERAAKSLPARLLAVEMCAAGGDPEGALRLLLSMLEYAGADGWVLAACAAERSGNRADAVAFCDRAEESVVNGFIAPHRRRMLAAVRARLSAGSLLNAMRVDAPPQPDAVDPVAEGEATVAAGDLDRAHALFVEAIDRDPGDVEAWRDLGVVFQRAGAIDAAAIALRMATELAPEDIAARLDLARCLWFAGQWSDAVGQLRLIVDLEPAARQMLEQLDVQGVRRSVVGLIGLDDEVGLADAVRAAGLRPLHAHADVVALMSPTLSPEDEEGVRAWMERSDPSMIVVGSGSSTADTWCRVAAEQGRTVIWTSARAPVVPVDDIVTEDIIGAIKRWVFSTGPKTMSTSEPLLSVIVPTYNRERELLALLDRLALQDIAPSMFEVIVVDDGSAVPIDRSALADRPYSLRVIRQANAGPAAARNEALQLATGRWALFLDDDAVPSVDLVRRHLVLQGHSVEPMAIMGGFELLQRHQRTVWDRVLSTTTLHMGRPGLVAGAAVGWRSFSIANTSIPMWALRAVDSFDAHGFTHAVYEDAELALRLESQLALPTIFHPEIQCGHDHRMTLDAWLERAKHAGEAQYRIRQRHSDEVDVLRLGRDGEPEQPLLDALRSVLEFGSEQVSDGERALRRVGSLRFTTDPVAMGQAIQTVQKLARLVGDACHQRGLVSAASAWQSPSVDPASPVSVILVHDSEQPSSFESVQRVVRGLRKNTIGPVELTIIVRGGDAHWISSQADLNVVMVARSTSLAMCWNAGLALATGATMMLCDDDILFTPGWRERLVSHMNSWSDVGIVAPLGAKTREELDSTAVSFARDHAGEHAWPVVVPGMRMLVRREVIAAIGGMDGSMGGMATDDFCMRAQVAGWRVRQAGDCLVGAIERSARPAMDSQERFRARWSLRGAVTRTQLREAVWAMSDNIVVEPMDLCSGPSMLLGEIEPAIEIAQGEQGTMSELAAAG
ncbi:MAG: glycosyltransferase involved in cell wall biosynthesis/tetratricopeptide (TPR) repeat protein [Kiritimatiellia bacterium]|jgi:glycosyltransferase involved in cell wall biosynthesis/tetratricopeptide (TPR) repeat protein